MNRNRLLGATLAVLSAALLMGAADGAWLDRVSARDHARVNPLLRTSELQQESASAGAQIYHADCAKCHGESGRGLHGRPPVIGRHVACASDGDLFWLMTNGNPWKGMPPWMMLPTTERWQLVTYLRSLNTTPLSAPTQRTVSITSLQGASR